MSKHLITLFLLCISVTVYGQYDIGFVTGPTLYTSAPKDKDFNDLYNNAVQVGFITGIYFEYMIDERLGLAPALYYSMKGKSTDIANAGYKNISRYHYIEAPLLFRYKLDKSSIKGVGVQPFINFGPNISYWLGGSGKLRGGAALDYDITFGDEASSDINIMNIVGANRWQWGIDFGGGASVDIVEGQKLYIDIRVGIGHTFLAITDGATLPILGFSDNMEVRFRSITLSGAYTFEVDWNKRKKGKSTGKIK